MTFWAQTPEGMSLTVRLTPKSAHDRIDGPRTLSDGRVVLAARVRAVPEKGKANQALIRLLSDMLSIPKSDITLIKGDTDRVKTLVIDTRKDLTAALKGF